MMRRCEENYALESGSYITMLASVSSGHIVCLPSRPTLLLPFSRALISATYFFYDQPSHTVGPQNNGCF